jgi:hypothetical protein
MADTTPQERDKTFNIRTNGMLDEIKQYLVDESTEQYSPKYTGILKQPAKATIEKWQKQVDALDKYFRDDQELGYIFYKLLLCQALVYYLDGDNDKALHFFNGAMTFERYDVVLYYLGIVRKLGGKVPKVHDSNKRPQSSLAFDLAMTDEKGKVPLIKHLTVGLPYAVTSHYSQWTSEEIDRYVFLRAIEWLALPAFVLIGLGALLLLVIPPLPLIIGLIVVNFTWSLFATRAVSLGVAEVSVYLNKLKFITIPIATIVLALRHDYKVAVLALLWAVVGILISLIRVNDKKGIIAHKFKQQIFLKTR